MGQKISLNILQVAKSSETPEKYSLLINGNNGTAEE